MRVWLALIVLIASAAVRAELLDAVAVVVGADVITLSELEERAGPELPPSTETGAAVERRRKLLQQAADEAIADKLLEREAAAQGMTPSSTEVDNAVADIKRTNNIDDATLARALAQQGLTIKRYREALMRQLTRMKVVEYRVKPRVTVSEDEVRGRYAKMTAGQVTKRELKVRDIFVPYGEDAAAARQRTEGAWRRLSAGEPFETVARETDGPLADSGGDLGWVTEGTMRPELEEQAFAMTRGQLGRPFEAGGGYHILRVEDERKAAGGAKSYEEARGQLRQQIVGERLQAATETYIAELRRGASVEVRLP